MKHLFFFFVVLCLLSVTIAHAEDVIVKPGCSVLPNHVASADTHYRSGVDAYGNDVAPADLPGTSAQDFSNVNVSLAPSLGNYIDANSYNFPDSNLNTVNVGALNVNGDQVSLNGKPIGGSAMTDCN